MNRPLTFLSVATFSTLALMSGTALSATKIGVVGAADATVNITSTDGTSRTVKLGDAIYANDTIKTNAQGKAQLIFEDRSTVTINENSEIKIDKFIYNPAKSDGEMTMKSVKGAFRFIGGALSKKKPVKIKTPVATIGIRGGIVDTHVKPTGATNAIFVFGDQMSITNPQGHTSFTTDHGTGFSLADTAAIPVPLPDSVVNVHLGHFMNINSNGGGAPTPPPPSMIQQNMQLDTGSKLPQPEPTTPTSPNTSASVAPAANSTVSRQAVASTPLGQSQAPAPVILVDDSNITTMEMAGAMSSESAEEYMTWLMETASETPEKLEDFATRESITSAGVALTANNSPNAAGTGTTTTPTADPTLASDQPVIDPTVIVVDDPTTNTPPPPAETFTPVTGVSGRFVVISDNNGMAGLQPDDIDNAGQIVVAEESATRLIVDFNSDPNHGGATRTFTIPKLTNTGFTTPVGKVFEEGGVTTTREVSGFKTKFGGMHVYHTVDAGALDTDPDKIVDFVFGEKVGTGAALDNAINHSKEYANAEGTNGILFYDFVPKLGIGDTNQFGEYRYNVADSSISTPVDVEDQTSFGVAIDYNDINGRKGNLFSGNVQWLPNGNGQSLATATFGKLDQGAKRLGYVNSSFLLDPMDPESFGYDNTKKGKFLNSVTRVDGGANENIYGADGQPIEGALLEYVTLNTLDIGGTPADVLGADNTAAQQFGELAQPDVNARVNNLGRQAIVLKDAALDAAITTSTNDGPPAAAVTQHGFASGVVLRHDGASSYEPIIFSNQDKNDISVTANPNGTVGANFVVNDNDIAGMSSNQRDITATFAAADSVYLNNKLYAAQQDTVDHSQATPVIINQNDNADGAKGFIVSSGLIHNASQHITSEYGAEYNCSSCEFVSWGVWAGDIGRNNVGNAESDYANMIPYVVGDITDNIGSNAALTGTATYKGEAYATVFNTGGSQTNPHNIAGKVDAGIDFNANKLTSFNLDFGDNVESAPLQLELDLPPVPAPGDYPDIQATGSATFNGALKVNGLAMTGNKGVMNGALFGPNAEEIGGNYQFERNDGLKGGGIYFGKR